MTARHAAKALGLAGLLALGACSESEREAGPIESETRSLASMLAADDDLDIIADAMNDAGLSQIFDGAAYYTLLAPTDSAFDTLGAEDGEIAEEDQRAALVAVMRDHILPGYLTTDDIAAAIETAGGSVQIQTMGEDALTFTEEGGDIRVVGSDGASAMILADEARAGNGVLLPVDGILKQL